MARRQANIDVRVVLQETDDPVILERWRRATEILLRALERKSENEVTLNSQVA